MESIEPNVVRFEKRFGAISPVLLMRESALEFVNVGDANPLISLMMY
jgi:hypothetical protein